MSADMSSEAVERLAINAEVLQITLSTASTALAQYYQKVATTLRALAQERDAAVERSKIAHNALVREIVERDAARAALRKIRDLGLGPDRGSAQWQIDAAREIARAALAATEGNCASGVKIGWRIGGHTSISETTL